METQPAVIDLHFIVREINYNDGSSLCALAIEQPPSLHDLSQVHAIKMDEGFVLLFLNASGVAFRAGTPASPLADTMLYQPGGLDIFLVGASGQTVDGLRIAP